MITDIILAVIYTAIAVYMGRLFVMSIWRRNQMSTTYTLPMLTLSFVVWALVKVFFHLAQTEEMVEMAYALGYPMKAFSVAFLLLYVIYFHDLQNYKKRAVTLTLLIMPVASVVWAVLTPSQGLMFTDAVVQIQHSHIIEANDTLLLWFYRVFVVTILTIMVYIVLSHNVQIPLIYREPSHQLTLGVLWLTGGYMVSWIQFSILPIDLLLLLSVLAMRYVHNSTKGTQGMLFLRRARNEVFNHLDQRVLILDEDNYVINANRSAKEWLGELGMNPNSRVNYQVVMDALNEKATNSQKIEEEDRGVDYYFDNNGETKTFNLREKVIFDNREHPIGVFVIYSDVTENRALLQRLEVSAGRDALTGLNNRNMMNHYKKEVDIKENLPLAFILCDLNNLKTVNDGHGHQHGDLMLRIAGEALLLCCPPSSMAGRIGGDEFLIVLPNTTQRQADELIELINSHLKEASKASPFDVTLAMGAAVKEKEEQSIEDIIVIADEIMYQNKRKIKGTRASEEPPRDAPR